MDTGQRQPERRPRGVRGCLEVRLADMPEVLSVLRQEMAKILREAAEDEPPVVAEFAHRVAAAFESGQG